MEEERVEPLNRAMPITVKAGRKLVQSVENPVGKCNKGGLPVSVLKQENPPSLAHLILPPLCFVTPHSSSP
jgi:hypothetical protein